MIIQFSHNGNELNLSRRSPMNGSAYEFNTPTTGYRFWNDQKTHYRKFIKQSGWYLEKIGKTVKPKRGELCFWGEWEPQSNFELTGNPYSTANALPHAIHYPTFSTSRVGHHNTDPFVFGEHFYYTNCKQNRYEILRTLENGSIIIYGSEKEKKFFVVDTVFVVENSETVYDYQKHPEDYPTILRQATIDLNGGLPSNFRLYKGKMYDFNKYYSETNSYTFCFVPCKVDCKTSGFERPIINWQQFNLQEPGAGTVTKKIDYRSEVDFWHDLVAELIRQGFSLGIKLDMPSTNDVKDF